MVGIITVNYFSETHTRTFIKSISNYADVLIVIVDNSNSLGTLNNATIIRPKINIGLSRAWKLGFNHIKNEVNTIIFANNDAVLSENFIDYCKNLDKSRRIIFGPKILDLFGNIWSAGGAFEKPFYNVRHQNSEPFSNQEELNVQHLSGCIWAIPKASFSDFDELVVDNFFFRGEEWYLNLIADRKGIDRILVNHPCVHDENGSHKRFSLKYLYFLYRAKWVFYKLSFSKTKGLLLNYSYIAYQVLYGIPRFSKKSDDNYFQILLILMKAYRLRNQKIIKEDEFSDSIPKLF